ncbi:hypothetical protein DEO72_LG9g1653 [Vigna unguiculata]|uniref:Uncharacterized protein n=1 Tax=Vigna unguiculata TaxID=3917 RepID=A0A4D6N2B3_VIGUN|nr:hypothetical protein DEO72_LG9g1653 [Vigna unguiculata]
MVVLLCLTSNYVARYTVLMWKELGAAPISFLGLSSVIEIVEHIPAGDNGEDNAGVENDTETEPVEDLRNEAECEAQVLVNDGDVQCEADVLEEVQPESGVSQVLPETQNMEDVQIEDGSSTDSIHEESDGLFDVDIDCDPGMVAVICTQGSTSTKPKTTQESIPPFLAHPTATPLPPSRDRPNIRPKLQHRRGRVWKP